MSGASPEEVWVLSYYRASELAGALLFGRLARRTADDELRSFLTRHFAEEAQHAWIWTETIEKIGATPLPIAETYQSQYASRAGLPSSMIEVLLLTETFERRIREHFQLHARRTRHPVVRATLERMLAEEEGHLDWIEQRLAAAPAEEVGALRARYQAVDEAIYATLRERERTLWEFLDWGEK